MARPSNRPAVLDAAVRVIESEGLGALTLDAVAAESGISKPGVLYHFASMPQLVAAVHEHLADTWEAEMVEALGGEPAQASARDRVRAYVEVMAHGTKRVEILMMADAVQEPAYAAAWQGVADRWVPAPPEASSDDAEATRRLFLGTLAADGLWSYEATTGRALAPDLRASLLADILRIAGLDDAAEPA